MRGKLDDYGIKPSHPNYPKTNRKDDVKPFIASVLKEAERADLDTKWKERWGEGTHIHHAKPLDFGGGNALFVPLKAAKHVGAGGVHHGFWSPLKAFLKNIGPSIDRLKASKGK